MLLGQQIDTPTICGHKGRATSQAKCHKGLRM